MADLPLEREALALLEEMFGVAAPERLAWIAERTQGRPNLRARLNEMLASEQQLSLHTGGAARLLEDTEMPDRVGAYRIVGLIGRGGMGAVYRGERDAGDFSHSVAIKVIKPGLLSQGLVDRFARERQTLATLTHPNIAQLFDGGQTPDHSPFIVMELINGEALLDWADATAATKANRLDVFKQICAGVAFAHANLVVHRDLTPSNVLVTADGTAKLIDFGIARPADTDGNEGTSPITGSLASLSLTPGYAAPERHISTAVTTAADIYSLGKLLTALFPNEKDPELYAIVAKATALAPEDRYSTVEALARDVSAWDRLRPVSAMNGGAKYVARKFIVRNWVGVAVGAMAATALVAASVVVTLSLGRERIARGQAEERFNQLRSLAGFMIFDLDAELARTVGNIQARRKLVDRAQVYLTALANTPNAPAEVRAEAGRGLATLAWVQGVAGSPNFGDFETARKNLKSAVALLDDPSIPAAVRGQELAFALLGISLNEIHRDTNQKAAAAALRRADDALRSVPADARKARWHLVHGALRRAQLDLAVIDGKIDQIKELADQLEGEIAARPASFRTNRDARFDRGAIDYYRSVQAYMANMPTESVAFARASTQQLQQLDAEVPNDPRVLYQLAWSAYVGNGAAQGVPSLTDDEALFLRLARTTINRLIVIEPLDRSLRSFAANFGSMEAQSAAVAGRFDDAMAIQKDVIDLVTSALGSDRAVGTLHQLVMARAIMANIAMKTGDGDVSCTHQIALLPIIAELERRDSLINYTKLVQKRLAVNIPICRGNKDTSAMTMLADQ